MNLQKIAQKQLKDYDRGKPGTLFADPVFQLSLEEAYELQFEIARLREQRGERLAGYKVGCISRAMQDQLELDRPVFGHVWESELRPSGSILDPARFDGLAIEGEFALRVDVEVPSAEWLKDHPNVFSSGFIVIELHNYVFRGSSAHKASELIANNAIHCGVVLPLEETPLEHMESMLDATVCVKRDGELLGESTGRGLKGGPFASVLQLTEHLEKYDRRLLPGQIVLTGSPLPLWRVSPGDSIEVVCEQFGGSVSASIQESL